MMGHVDEIDRRPGTERVQERENVSAMVAVQALARFDIYARNHDNSARFLLGTEGKKKLFVMGVNPSTADARHADHTIRKIEGFIRRAGFDGFVMANIYPARATNPHLLDLQANQHLIDQNITQIITQLQQVESPLIWAAWGNTIEKRAYLFPCLEHLKNAIRPYHPKWLQCGSLTRRNHPRHPSRLSYDMPFQEFEIDRYCESLNKSMLPMPISLMLKNGFYRTRCA